MLKNIFTVFILLVSYTSFGQSFTTTWLTTNPGVSANNEITIPTAPGFTYNYTVAWGDGSTDTNITGDITHPYATPGTYTVTISGNFPSIYFNNAGDKEKIIEILEWGTIQWQSMENAFYGCTNINFDAIDSPDLSQVTSLKNMFMGCTAFNGIVNDWDVSNITDISGLFAEAEIFNRPLDTWNTAAITDMSYTFHRTRLFNEPLDNWNTASVNTMEYMFSEASNFNQNINNWDVSQVTTMFGTFRYTGAFDKPLNNWNLSNVTNTASMFQGSSFNQDISNWVVSNVTTMSAMFREAKFNHPINNWDVAQVTDMSFMFHRHRTYNQPLNNWNVSNVTTMASMFDGWIWGAIYNQPLDNWDVSAVTDMNYMFRENSGFNQDISNWNVSNVTNMLGMFQETSSFNQDISGWDVSNVTNMSAMFQESEAFNQTLNNWNISNVTDLSSMFFMAAVFNQPLNNWDVSKVTTFEKMFGESNFNQNISNWITTTATTMNSMFLNASNFNQNLALWNISNITNMTFMLSNSGMSQENYDDTLIGWGTQTVQDDINLGATSLNYCDGRIARQNLIDNHNWSFIADIINCPFVLCTTISSPIDGDTNVPANFDIRWAPAPNATGYLLNVRVERSGSTIVIANNEDVGNVIGVDFTDDFVPGDVVYATVTPYNIEGPAIDCNEISFTIVKAWNNSPDAFILTIDTRILDSNSSADSQLSLEINSTFSSEYDFSIDWGDHQFNNNVTSNLTHSYLTPGVYTISIIGNYPAHYYSSPNRDNDKLVSIDQWGTQEWKSMRQAFYYCETMTYNATDIPDLSAVTNMDSMFGVASSFNGNINNWDVSNVTDMSFVFISTSEYDQPLDNWDVSNVTSMRGMFLGTKKFNQPIENWDVSSVTTMSRMFEQAAVFNQPLNNWDVSSVTNMSDMFERAVGFNQPLNNWDVSNVTNMAEMFNGFVTNLIFNQPLDNWDVSNVLSMNSMFDRCIDFNQSLNNWDVGKVKDMGSMFDGAKSFNQPLNNWDVSSVIQMNAMFSNASTFNQNINSWDVTNVINTSFMFSSATAFNQPLNNWNVNSVVNMSSMFNRAEAFNQPLDAWEVSAVANMSSTFQDAILFNQPINSWDVSSVTLMNSMFDGALVFNQNINNWNVAAVTTMESMFKEASIFNQPLANWDTGEVITMREMFTEASAFDQPIENWDTSFVSTMEAMFKDATSFNQPLNSWNVASVTTMQGMFNNATSFNGSIDGWNVRKVTTMQDMFNTATAFNQTINSWRVAGVSNMDRMFQNASSYDQSFDRWDIGNVSMRSMFENASVLNQYFGDWNISNVSNMSDMLDNTALIRENYDNTLIAWSKQALSAGINLGAEGLSYCDALEERQSMIANFGWIITDDILDCPIPECTQLSAPLNGDTDIPVNTNLNWEPVLFARGYYLTVRVEPGNTIIVNNETVNNTFYEFTSEFSDGDTVYVTLTPFNNEGDAVGCTEESFAIISGNPATVPECTNLTIPLNAAIDVALDTDLEWSPVPEADGYRITVGTTTGGTDILNNEDVGSVTTYDLITNLPEDTTIYITVIPYNEEGDATGCIEESFKTELIPVPPACTNLTSPLNGATNIAIDTNISWNAIDDATGYLVIVGTTQNGIEVANNIDVGNVTSYNFPTDLRENRTHYVTIIPYNEVGDAMSCTEENFRTAALISPLPNCTSLSDPLNGAINMAVDTDLSWNTATDATGYKITMGTSTGGTDILSNVNVGNVTTLDLPSDLPENTQIFVTITPYNDTGDASGCAEESFTTETTATVPNCTTLSGPLNAATNVAIDTDLSWNTIANATGYRITVGTTASGTDILSNVNVGNVTTLDLTSDLPENTQIFVTITPYNDMGDASGCAEESFTTETTATVPNCTTLSSPLNAATNVAIDTDLSWNTIANATGYRITVGTTASGTDILNDTNVGNVTTLDLPSDLPENTQIFVTITPYNDMGDASGCVEESFTTEAPETVPNCTTLSNPLIGATNVAIDTDLSWNTVTNATGYRITIGTTAGGTDILNDEDVAILTSYNPVANLPLGTTIYVNITPYNDFGDASGCSEASFTTVNENKNKVKYGFSPDGDGINEYWHIEGIEQNPDNIVTIYNRWGDMVFQIQGYNNASRVFRGIANKKTKIGANVLPDGTYFFNFSISGTHNFEKLQGYLVLKR